jgi:peptidoglycan/xylan/chitin deacetylase (PgdA/CDA1 family)
MKVMSPITRPGITVRVIVALTVTALLVLAGCGGGGGDKKPSASEARANLDKLLEKGMKPNEMGMVMVLEYHRIKENEGSYTRSVENFKKDLETLYQKGYRLVSFHDLMAGKIGVPAGTTPVVFSFDDSTESQFRYIKEGDKTVIDPQCALGMMQSFYQKHKDFGYTAQFNYLPAMFEQPEYVKEKVEYLNKNGFELGDHTITHPLLGKMPDDQVQKEIAVPVKNMKNIDPSVKVDVLCLPNGSIPKNQGLMYDGSWEGTKYHNNWSLLVGSNPFYPSYHYKNPDRLIPRIQVMDYNTESGAGADGSGYWLRYFDQHPEQRFVSDGDSSTVSAPAYMESRLLQDKLPAGTVFVGY